MTVQQLEYFITAARNLNFTKTADAFFISQSAITQQIRNLEQELNVKLFYRKNKKLELTAAGKLFISEAESIIERINDAIQKVRAAQNGMTGNLNIGYLKCMEMSRFPRSVSNFHNNYPGVRVNLKRDNAVALHDDFLRGKYDIIFNIEHEILTYPDICQRQIGEYPFYVILHPNHPLARKKQIHQKDLRHEKLIIHDLHREIPGSPELIPRQYLSNDIMANVIKTEEDVETILIMVASGIGLAVLPDFDIRKPQINLNLVYIPLDTNGYMEKINVFYRKEEHNPLVPLFLQEV